MLPKTILNKLYQIDFRKKLCNDSADLQKDLDESVTNHNDDQTHQETMFCERILIETLLDSKMVWAKKLSSNLNLQTFRQKPVIVSKILN